jgi:hypothetical protein
MTRIGGPWFTIVVSTNRERHPAKPIMTTNTAKIFTANLFRNRSSSCETRSSRRASAEGTFSTINRHRFFSLAALSGFLNCAETTAL